MEEAETKLLVILVVVIGTLPPRYIQPLWLFYLELIKRAINDNLLVFLSDNDVQRDTYNVDTDICRHHIWCRLVQVFIK